MKTKKLTFKLPLKAEKKAEILKKLKDLRKAKVKYEVFYSAC